MISETDKCSYIPENTILPRNVLLRLWAKLMLGMHSGSVPTSILAVFKLRTIVAATCALEMLYIDLLKRK